MIPLVLCGGTGTRLWPVSRASQPKQFAELFDEALLAKTLRRLAPLGPPRVVSTEGQRLLTARVLSDLALPPERAIYEPRGRNTAPAVALACRLLQRSGDGAVVVGIFPADHLVTDVAAFHRACRLAERCAAAGEVVTLGIRPTAPATGYGYIEVTDEVVAEADDGGLPLAARRAAGFREKPDAATARRFVEAGSFFWNAGMFVFQVDVMAGHFERLMPQLWAALDELADDRSNLAEIYQGLSGESIDYGVMEKLERLVSIPCEIGWSDVGSWDEVARLAAAGGDPLPAGTATGGAGRAPASAPPSGAEPHRGGGPGPATTFEVDGSDNFVFPHGERVYGLVGVSDLLVVDTADALLVTRKGRSQKVKEVVQQLAAAGRREAAEHVYEHRPWGGFEVLRDTERFKSKILWVLPGQRLSYQSHRHRSEHWVVVRGRPEVVLDGEVLRPKAGEAVYIPQGAKHRLGNPGNELVEVVEVQLGSYFGEDDIVRYEDDYDRS